MNRAIWVILVPLVAVLMTAGGSAFVPPVAAGLKGPSASTGKVAGAVARPAQQPQSVPGGGNGPNDPPDKIPRGAGDSGAPAGGGAIIESGKNYALEYGILLVLVGAALGAVCKSSHRV